MNEYARNAIDIMSIRITELLEELNQLRNRRAAALETIEKQREEIRNLKKEIEKNK